MKGTIFDILVVGIICFVTLITVILCVKILTEFSNVASASGNTTLNSTYFNQGIASLQVFNYGIAMVFIMGVIGSILLAMYLNVNPAYLIVSILLLIIVVAIIFPVISNVYGEIATTNEFSTIASQFNVAEMLMTRLPLFVAVGGALVIIVLYTRMRSEDRTV